VLRRAAQAGVWEQGSGAGVADIVLVALAKGTHAGNMIREYI